MTVPAALLTWHTQTNKALMPLAVAVFGQFYLAILVARLVALHVSQEQPPAFLPIGDPRREQPGRSPGDRGSVDGIGDDGTSPDQRGARAPAE